MTFDWGAFALCLIQADADIKANTPLIASAPMSLADIAAVLQAAQPKLSAVESALIANPGYVRAAARVLTELSRQGIPLTGDLEAALSDLPGGLAAADSWLPTIIGALRAFTPAPGWEDGGTGYQPGSSPYRGR